MAELPPPPHEVEVVVVYPPRLAPLGGEAAFSAVQIGAEQLKDTPRLDDALKRVPGVSLFRRTGSGGANPTIQGLSLRSIAPSGAGRALVTLDGAPQNDPFGGWVIWSALPPEGLDGAMVVRGAGAGPYGAGALTGVVALQERGARDGISALDVSAGERSSYRAAAAVGGPNLLLTAAGETTDGYVPVRGRAAGAADTPTDLHDWTLAFRAQHAVGDAEGAARLGVYEERRNAGLKGARSIASGASAAFTLARAAAEGVGGWRLQAWARASDLKNSSVAVAAGRATTTPANDQYATPAQGYGLNAALQGKRGDLSWEVGGDVRYATGREAERFRVMNGAFTRGREAGGKTLVGGVYVEGAYDTDPWLVTGGVRLDGWRSTDAKRREWDLANGATTLSSATPDNSGATPTARFGVRYSLSEHLWFRGAAYAGFRPPTLNELHRPFRVGNDITEANPGLKPETLQGVEAGVGVDSRWARWSGTLFYNRLVDPITNVTIGIGPGTFPLAGFIPAGGVLRQRQNAGEITAWGYESETSGELGGGLGWRWAGAYTHAEVDGGGGAPQLTGKRPAQVPELTVTAGLDWRGGPFSAALDARYESKRFEDDLNTRILSPGVGLDARVAWRLDDSREVYVSAENLLDQELEVGETADGVESFSAPRTLRVGFSFRR